jgi:hypothetical protein
MHVIWILNSVRRYLERVYSRRIMKAFCGILWSYIFSNHCNRIKKLHYICTINFNMIHQYFHLPLSQPTMGSLPSMSRTFGCSFANQIQVQIGYSYPAPRPEDITNQMRINNADNNNRFVVKWALNNTSYYSSETLPLLAWLMNPRILCRRLIRHTSKGWRILF